MTENVGNEQLKLLKFEKQLVALTATFAAGAATVASAAEKTGNDVPLRAYEDVQAALIKLGEATSAAHTAVETAAVESSLRFLQAGPMPKERPVVEIVRSLLGVG